MTSDTTTDVRAAALDEQQFDRFYGAISNSLVAELLSFRRQYPDRVLHTGQSDWRYRVIGSTASPPFLLIPGGDMLNDLAFRFATALSNSGWRVIYPAYPVSP